jgi:hypothetical protein
MKRLRKINMKIRENHSNERIEDDKEIQIKKTNLAFLDRMRSNSLHSLKNRANLCSLFISIIFLNHRSHLVIFLLSFHSFISAYLIFLKNSSYYWKISSSLSVQLLITVIITYFENLRFHDSQKKNLRSRERLRSDRRWR